MFDLWGQVDRGRLTHDLVNSQVHDFVDFAIALSYETRDYSIIADGQRVFSTRSLASATSIHVIIRGKRDAYPNMLIVVCLHQTSSPVKVSRLAGMQSGCANGRLFYRTAPIYTTIIGELPAKSCPQKAVLRKLSSKLDEFLAGRSWRRFLCAYMLPIRDLCAIAFCVCPLFFTTENQK